MVGDFEREVTGIMVYYYVICQRKLWYFYYNINMEQNNEDVQIGKMIDENTYKREDKHINIDNVISIDFIKSKNILNEVKKSKKIEEASILQVKYYLYYLQKKGVHLKAKIDYPLLKDCVEVELKDEDILEIEKIVKDLKEVVKLKFPPKIEKKGYCKKCAFYDLCFI